MKRLTLLALALTITIMAIGQSESTNGSIIPKTSSITVGFLQGGGSLIGFDFETLVTDRVGVQVGGGYIGFGAGINYHLKPTINSSFLSLAYWNQGFAESFAQNLMGGSFVFRARKIFTAQLGIGFPLSKGPAWPADMEQPPVMLIYSIGFYIPL